MVLAVAVILYKRLRQKSELERIQAVTEKERSFSRDLHDGVAQDLAAIKVYIEQGDAEKSAGCASHALNEVRFLIDSLHFPLGENPLQILKETLTSFQANHKIKTTIAITSRLIEKLKTEQQLEILRIVQEALSNVARHSGANSVSVKIIDVASSLRIVIHDDGNGFSESTPPGTDESEKRSHHGLSNIRERVASLGGTVQFIHGEGTTIAICIENIVS